MKDLALVAFIVITVPCYSQHKIIGKWKTIDDNTGAVRSVVELYERDKKIFGKVTRIFPAPGEDPDPVCDECDAGDSRYMKKIIGMEILKYLTKNGDIYSDGEILDPEVGKVYRCKIWLEGPELKVRGYWGPFFRTQTWKRESNG